MIIIKLHHFIINTQSFINVPTSKMGDINISTLLEIIQK